MTSNDDKNQCFFLIVFQENNFAQILCIFLARFSKMRTWFKIIWIIWIIWKSTATILAVRSDEKATEREDFADFADSRYRLDISRQAAILTALYSPIGLSPGGRS